MTQPSEQHVGRSGFTFLEILVAVGIITVIAVAALHSRSVIIRAEHKAYRLDEARMLMRGLVAHRRAGMENDDLLETLPAEWQWTETPISTDVTDSAGAHHVATWHVWRLIHHGSGTTLEIAVDNIGGNTNAQESLP